MYAWWDEHVFIRTDTPFSATERRLLEKSRTFDLASERITQRRFKAAAVVLAACAAVIGYMFISQLEIHNGFPANGSYAQFMTCTVLALACCVSIREAKESKQRCETMMVFLAREGSDFTVIDERYPFWQGVLSTPEWETLATEMRGQTTIGSMLIAEICNELQYNYRELITMTISGRKITQLKRQGKELGNRLHDLHEMHVKMVALIPNPQHAT